MVTRLVINSVGDAFAAALLLLESAREEVVWLVPPSIHALSRRYGFVERTRAFVQHGGVLRGILEISRANVKEVQVSLENSEDIRHSDTRYNLYMYVADRRGSVSAINIGVDENTLNTPIVAFWSDDPTYAEYLLAEFERAWSHAIPIAQRIRELSK